MQMPAIQTTINQQILEGHLRDTCVPTVDTVDNQPTKYAGARRSWQKGAYNDALLRGRHVCNDALKGT
jgi:hypothetical protein